MEKYLEQTKDQIIMGFVASCIESVADRLNLGYRNIFERMEKVGMIDDYIYPCYEQLHTESRENLTESLIATLNRWEKELKVCEYG
ncbi:MAG: DUF3791 domain-containing protein [Muribaculaceae bacterium]|nr:DUF3791 domain-containing protein [Muribaculaceae bacterium]